MSYPLLCLFGLLAFVGIVVFIIERIEAGNCYLQAQEEARLLRQGVRRIYHPDEDAR
jgi:hypothetical protein